MRSSDVQFHTYVRAGAIAVPTQYRDVIAGMDGEEVEVLIRTKRRRTRSQNALYWAVVIPQVAEGIKALGTHVTYMEAHEFLKSRFLDGKVLEVGDEVLTFSPTTTNLDKTQFNEYIDKICEFADSYLNVSIEL